MSAASWRMVFISDSQLGVTIVQYRDKVSGTAELVQTATQLHTVTRRYGVPLLINDRVDVALAIDAEGVHLGQDDLDLVSARRLMGPEAIIGVTCSNVDEAYAAAVNGCDYIGIGTLFATSTYVQPRKLPLGISAQSG